MDHNDQSFDLSPPPILSPPPAYQSPREPQVSTTDEQVEWETGLCEFEDAASFCYGFWCCPCLSCTVSQKLGEKYCLPLCDIQCCLASLAFHVPLVPAVALSLRVAMRKKYNIRGSLLNDMAVSCCCSWCVWCQMHRELKHQERDTKVVTVQNVVTVQPTPSAPMMKISQVTVDQTTTVNTALLDN